MNISELSGVGAKRAHALQSAGIFTVADLLNHFPRDYDDRTCIIVVELHNVSVGMIIDSVSEVITLEEEDIATPPTFSNIVDVRFIKGIGKTDHGIKLILDCAAVLDDVGIPIADME